MAAFLYDPFTGSNGVSVTSHTTYTTWADVMAGGTAAKLYNNRLRGPEDDSGSTFVYSDETPPSANYYVEGTMYLAQNQGCNYDQLDVGVGARCSTSGGGAGYVFGWNCYWARWELYKYVGGGYSVVDLDDVTDVSRTAGETKYLRIRVVGTGSTVTVTCTVDGVTVISYADTASDRITATGNAALIITSDLRNFHIDAIEADVAPVEAPLTGIRSTARTGAFLFPGNFVYDTFTDTADLSVHVGEVGATWTIAQRSGSNDWSEDGASTQPKYASSPAYYRAYASCASPAPQVADYVVEATLDEVSGSGGWVTNVLRIGVVARMSSDGQYGYGFGVGLDYGGEGNSWMLVKFASLYGGNTVLDAVNYGAATWPAVIKLVVSGTEGTVTLRGFVDGVEVCSYDDTSSPITSVGKPGLASYTYLDPWWRVNEFKAYYDLSVSGEGALEGERATTTAGALAGTLYRTPDGLRATATAGELTPRVTVGFVSAGVLAPVATRTTQVHADTNPGFMSSAMLAAGGVLYGVATRYDLDYNYWSARRGLYKVDLTARDTYPWTSYGKGADGSDDELNVDCLTWRFEHTKTFPRAGGYSPSTAHYNAALSTVHGFISATPGGDVQTAVVRSFRDDVGAFLTQYLAWQQGTFDEIANPYAGPELLVGTYSFVSDATSEVLNHRAPLGIYAVSASEALAFYPRFTHAADSGTVVRLVGNRARLAVGAVTPSVVGSAALTGVAATTRIGSFTELIRDRALTGLRATTSTGRVSPANSQTSAPPAYRRLRNGAWGAEVVLSGATGAASNWALSESLTVTHSGYGSVVYATYFSAQDPTAGTPTHVGLLVMDAVSGVVHSHTLTQLTDTQGTWWAPEYDGSYRDKTQTGAVTLTSGVSVTQYVQKRHVLHLSWTFGTYTSPTLTVKNGPTGTLVPGWESLEVRGDEVYHVLYADASITYTPESLRVNDATGTGSTWTTIAGAVSGGTWSDGGYTVNHHAFLSGGAPGEQTWLYDSRARFSAGYTYDAATYWENFWSGQAPVLSVSARGKVGRVTTSVRENPTLVGERLTSTAGTLYAWVVMPLSGERVTITPGYLSMPLSGARLVSTVGSLGGTQYVELSGERITVDTGDVTPDVSGDRYSRLTGERFTVRNGYVKFSGTRLDGLRVSMQLWDLGIQHSEVVPLVGARVTSAAGGMGAAVAQGLSGERATLAFGTITARIAIPYWQLRNTAVVRAGRLTAENSAQRELLGIRATVTAGTVGRTSGAERATTGERVTSAAGDITPLLVVSLTGVRATARSGGFIPLVSVALDGQVVVSEQGVFQLLLNVFLTGQQGVITAGALSAQHGGTVAVVGVAARGQVGDVTQGMPKPQPGSLLWVFTPPEELATKAEPADTIVVAAPHA